MKTLNHFIQKGISHAIKLHDLQLRKGTEDPYSIHPISLAMMLIELDLSPEIITAALLHDVIEDTEWTYDDLEEAYNPEIALLVKACTEENRSEKWELRKERTIEKFNTLSDTAKWVVLADKLHNLFSMYQQYQLKGEAVWQHFSRGSEKQKWYYSQLKSEFEKENTLRTSNLYKEYVHYFTLLFERR